jgi:hypothetical protein
LWDFLSSTYKTMDKVQNKPNSSVHNYCMSEQRIYSTLRQKFSMRMLTPVLIRDQNISPNASKCYIVAVRDDVSRTAIT